MHKQFSAVIVLEKRYTKQTKNDDSEMTPRFYTTHTGF